MIKHERDWWIVEYDDYGSTGCRVFSGGIKNKQDFCLKYKYSKEIIEFWELLKWGAWKWLKNWRY